ncbi:MAG: pyridoxal phosphate-dependent aminotransferase [Eudoraea sp.]|nr:pyridoxal phosphate-dependent aminotransferase [Eudoraea sp.]
MKIMPRQYRFNNIINVRYEQFEKLPRDLMSDPDAVFLWGDEYWQHIPQFVLDYLTEVVNSYDLDTKTNSKAKRNWYASDYRDAIAEKLLLEDGIKLDNPAKQIGTCHGAADGFACIAGIFLEPGDEVLVVDPQFTFAWGLPDLHRAKTISIPISEEGNWNISEEDVPDLIEPKINDKTKMMIMCMPGNPTGTVFSHNTTKAIGDILSDNEIIYLEDSVYERRVYDDNNFVSMGAIPSMKDYSVCVRGFSKIYNVRPFRTGYIVANEEIIDKVWRWHMLGGIDPSSIYMKVLSKCLRKEMSEPLPPRWHEAYKVEWDVMRKRTFEAINDNPWLSCSMPQAGTFHFVNTSRLGPSDELFAILRDKYKVLLTPGTWYGPNGEGYMRLCYAANLPEDTMIGVNRFLDAVNKIALNKGL